MTARYCPRSIPARIVYRIPRYSIGLSFAQNWIPHKGRTAIRPGAEDFGKKQRANAQALFHHAAAARSPENLSTDRPHSCNWVRKYGRHEPDNPSGFVEDAELSKHCGTIVINLFTC